MRRGRGRGEERMWKGRECEEGGMETWREKG